MKPISPQQRAEEIRLLKEYEAAGKIKRLDYVEPEHVEMNEEQDAEFEYGSEWRRHEGRSALGDGNFRLGFRAKG